MALGNVKNKAKELICSPLGEGFIAFMYLDTTSHVTVGWGNMLPGAQSAADVNFFDASTKKAVDKETKSNAWQVVQAISPADTPINALASRYETLTKIRIDEAEADRLFAEKLDGFISDLVGLFPKFSSYPENCQVALIDMIYNLGSGKLTGKFPRFCKAIKSCDWRVAAAESNRPQLSFQRNENVRKLLLGIDTVNLSTAKRSEKVGSAVLRIGNSGDRVKYAQKKMNVLARRKHLFLTAEDGTFGHDTERLVKQLQNLFGLKVDGWIGIRTLRILDGV